jgi:hypothetical protein
MFTIILSNNYPKISGKIGFTIEEKAFLLERYFQNRVNRQPIKRLCIHCKYNYAYDQSKTNVSIKQKIR